MQMPFKSHRFGPEQHQRSPEGEIYHIPGLSNPSFPVGSHNVPVLGGESSHQRSFLLFLYHGTAASGRLLAHAVALRCFFSSFFSSLILPLCLRNTNRTYAVAVAGLLLARTSLDVVMLNLTTTIERAIVAREKGGFKAGMSRFARLCVPVAVVNSVRFDRRGRDRPTQKSGSIASVLRTIAVSLVGCRA